MKTNYVIHRNLFANPAKRPNAVGSVDVNLRGVNASTAAAIGPMVIAAADVEQRHIFRNKQYSVHKTENESCNAEFVTVTSKTP